MRPIAKDGWPEAIEEFQSRSWEDRALRVLNLRVESMSAREFRRIMERWDAPVRARFLRGRSDQRGEVALLQRVGVGAAVRGCAFESNDLNRFFALVGSLNLEPLPFVRDGSEAVLFEPTPRNLTFGGRFWPSVGSAALLLYLLVGGFVPPRLRVCELPDCGKFFMSDKKWARWCSVAHRVAGSRRRQDRRAGE